MEDRSEEMNTIKLALMALLVFTFNAVVDSQARAGFKRIEPSGSQCFLSENHLLQAKCDVARLREYVQQREDDTFTTDIDFYKSSILNNLAAANATLADIGQTQESFDSLVRQARIKDAKQHLAQLMPGTEIPETLDSMIRRDLSESNASFAELGLDESQYKQRLQDAYTWEANNYLKKRDDPTVRAVDPIMTGLYEELFYSSVVSSGKSCESFGLDSTECGRMQKHYEEAEASYRKFQNSPLRRSLAGSLSTCQSSSGVLTLCATGIW